jgi:hypothetical protein
MTVRGLEKSRLAMLAALLLLSASVVGVSLSDTAKAETIKQDTYVPKVKTSDKQQKQVRDFVKGRTTPDGAGPTSGQNKSKERSGRR